jgi:hypothetical protein
MPTKAIFLDVDGVILPLGAEQFDQTAIERINALAHQARAEIAISSSWRRHVGSAETIDALVAAGLAKPLCCLQESSEFSTKAEDVAAWLNGHAEIEAWALIDDDPAVCRSLKALKDHRGLVVEVGAGGFGQSAFSRALRHLQGHRVIGVEQMPAEFMQALQQPHDNPDQAALNRLLDEEE